MRLIEDLKIGVPKRIDGPNILFSQAPTHENSVHLRIRGIRKRPTACRDIQNECCIEKVLVIRGTGGPTVKIESASKNDMFF